MISVIKKSLPPSEAVANTRAGGSFYAEVESGILEHKEAEAVRRLTKDELDDVERLPADKILIDKIKA